MPARSTHTHIHVLITHTHRHTQFAHMYIHVHTFAHIYIHISTHPHTHTHINTYTHAHIHTYIHVHAFIHPYIHTFTYMYTYSIMHAFTCSYVCIHTHIHTCVPTHMEMPIHIHIHPPPHTLRGHILTGPRRVDSAGQRSICVFRVRVDGRRVNLLGLMSTCRPQPPGLMRTHPAGWALWGCARSYISPSAEDRIAISHRAHRPSAQWVDVRREEEGRGRSHVCVILGEDGGGKYG